MNLPNRFISLAILVHLISHAICGNINISDTSSISPVPLVDLDSNYSKSEALIIDDWGKIAQEAGIDLDETEVLVTSQPVQLTKRSNSDSELTTVPPKKKPVMYSWWMPNMVNGGQNSVTTTTLSTVTEDELEQTTKNPTGTRRPRPTRKPRPTLRPKNPRPSTTASVNHTKSPNIESTSQSTVYSTTQSTPKINLTTSTQPPQSSFNRALEIKTKLLNIAKVVGGVALIAKGTAGQIAVSTTGVDPYVQIAGKVGTLAASTAVQVAPVAKSVALQAGSLAASALYKAGTLAVSGAGRAFEAISTRISEQRSKNKVKEDCEDTVKIKLKSENEVTMRDIPIITMTTRAIKTSPRPHGHENKHQPKSNDMEVVMEVVTNKGHSSEDHDSEPKAEPESESAESASETAETRDVPKIRMSTGGDQKYSDRNSQKSLSVLDKADFIVICAIVGVQLLVNRLYFY